MAREAIRGQLRRKAACRGSSRAIALCRRRRIRRKREVVRGCTRRRRVGELAGYEIDAAIGFEVVICLLIKKRRWVRLTRGRVDHQFLPEKQELMMLRHVVLAVPPDDVHHVGSNLEIRPGGSGSGENYIDAIA